MNDEDTMTTDQPAEGEVTPAEGMPAENTEEKEEGEEVANDETPAAAGAEEAGETEEA